MPPPDVQSRIDAALATGHPGQAKRIAAAWRRTAPTAAPLKPRVQSPEIAARRSEVRRLREAGLTLRAIAALVDVSHEQVRLDLKEST